MATFSCIDVNATERNYETGKGTAISKYYKVMEESSRTTPDTDVKESEKKIEPMLEETALNGKKFWTTYALNMRVGAGASHGRMLTIPVAREVKGLAKVSNGWYKVEYSGKTGYVSGKYLSETKVNPPKPPAPKEKTYSPMTIHFPGKTVPFKNGGVANGQKIIDANYQMASTWGGAETFSGSDGKNTHIVAHNPGAFTGIWKHPVGTKIIIVDHNGHKTEYVYKSIFVVNDNGIRVDNGENMYGFITSTRGGEVVTFQTCKNSAENWIIRAERVN